MSPYSELLQHPKWQKRRLHILERDNYTCQLCGDTETMLHVHHMSYHGDPLKTPDEDLTTLCKHCHAVVEDIKKSLSHITIQSIFKVERNRLPIILFAKICFNVDSVSLTNIFIYSYIDDKLDLLTGLRLSHISDLLNLIKSIPINVKTG